MSEDPGDADGADEDRPEHLDDLPDGSGCVEIWDRLSERRAGSDE